MKDGKLSKRERETLWKAYDTLNAWINWHEEHDDSSTSYDLYTSCCEAAGALSLFLSWVSD